MIPIVCSMVRGGDVLLDSQGKQRGRVIEVTGREVVAVVDGHEARWGRHILCPTFSTLPVPKLLREALKPTPIEGNFRLARQ